MRSGANVGYSAPAAGAYDIAGLVHQFVVFSLMSEMPFASNLSACKAAAEPANAFVDKAAADPAKDGVQPFGGPAGGGGSFGPAGTPVPAGGCGEDQPSPAPGGVNICCGGGPLNANLCAGGGPPTVEAGRGPLPLKQLEAGSLAAHGRRNGNGNFANKTNYDLLDRKC